MRQRAAPLLPAAAARRVVRRRSSSLPPPWPCCRCWLLACPAVLCVRRRRLAFAYAAAGCYSVWYVEWRCSAAQAQRSPRPPLFCPCWQAIDLQLKRLRAPVEVPSVAGLLAVAVDDLPLEEAAARLQQLREDVAAYWAESDVLTSGEEF